MKIIGIKYWTILLAYFTIKENAMFSYLNSYFKLAAKLSERILPNLHYYFNLCVNTKDEIVVNVFLVPSVESILKSDKFRLKFRKTSVL